MSGYSAKSLDELPSLWDGFARLVRPGLEITAFGANIMNLPPDYSTKSHDESESGQQELYVALQGSGSVDVDGRQLPLDAITLDPSLVEDGDAEDLLEAVVALAGRLGVRAVAAGVRTPEQWALLRRTDCLLGKTPPDTALPAEQVPAAVTGVRPTGRTGATRR